MTIKWLCFLLIVAGTAFGEERAALKFNADNFQGTAWVTFSRRFQQKVLVTNAHNCRNDDINGPIKKATVDGLDNIKIVFIDPVNDVCLLTFTDVTSQRPYKQLKIASKITYPSEVVSESFPGGIYTKQKQNFVGVISVPVDWALQTRVQTSTIFTPHLSHGCSGGPVMDEDGNVISMLYGMYKKVDVNFGVNWNDLDLIINGEN